LTSILIREGTILTLDPKRPLLRDGAVFIEDGSIVDLGDSPSIPAKFPRAEFVVDAKGKIVIPGLVNSHTHFFQTLLRGLGDDRSLFDWIRDVIRKNSGKIDARTAKAASALGCLEMIRTGVTTVVDHQTVNPTEEVVDSVANTLYSSGLRGYVARGMRVDTAASDRLGVRLGSSDEESEIRATENLVHRWKDGKRVRVCPGPSSTFSSTPGLLVGAGEISGKYHVPLHIHVAERQESERESLKASGKREVEHLLSLGVLGELTQVVHGVWLDENEILALARARSSVVHCPVSNMYLASGTAPLRSFISSRVNVALGTDGPASNNSHDMFEVMKAAALLCKLTSGDPGALTAGQALAMATLGGAKAAGLLQSVGTIEVGKRADITVVDPRRPHSIPVHNPSSTLVYSCNWSNVSTVICDGAPLMVDGRVLTMEEEAVISESESAAEAFA